MNGTRLAQSEYAQQSIVMLFGQLLRQVEEAGLTHTYLVVVRFCKHENMDSLVLRYWITGASPCEE
jgi:hypothetical protein